MRVDTGYRPRPFQREIHQALAKHRFSVLVCHRRFGKTVLAVNALIDAALRFKGGDGRFGYVAPLFKQAKRASWDYFRKYASPIPGVKFNESELTVTFQRNNSKIYIDGADNPDGLRGGYYDGVVPDEVAQMKPDLWGEVLRPMLSDRNGWCLFIGTPKGQNILFDLWEKAQVEASWYAGMYRADETSIISDAELALARSALSDAQYRQEYLCDFTASTDDSLITIDLVSAACARSEVFEESLLGLPKVLTADIARFGDDRTVILKRHGHVVYKPEVFQGLDNMHVAGMIAQRWEEWKPDACFIDGGRGEGVIDRLRQTGYSPIEVQFGGKPLNPHYQNKRAEMWALTKEWLEKGGNLPNHTDLKSDLCAPTYDFDAMGRMRLESKDSMKKAGRRSPDIGDALALSFAFPVQAALRVDPLHETFNKGRVVNEYDPYPAEVA